MKPKDWFAVGVRLLGVWMLISAADEVILLANIEFGFNRTTNGAGLYVVHAVGDIVVALCLFLGVKPLTSLAGPWADAAAGSPRCPTCGYDLRATPGRCPECGTADLALER